MYKNPSAAINRYVKQLKEVYTLAELTDATGVEPVVVANVSSFAGLGRRISKGRRLYPSDEVRTIYSFANVQIQRRMERLLPFLSEQ